MQPRSPNPHSPRQRAAAFYPELGPGPARARGPAPLPCFRFPICALPYTALACTTAAETQGVNGGRSGTKRNPCGSRLRWVRG